MSWKQINTKQKTTKLDILVRIPITKDSTSSQRCLKILQRFCRLKQTVIKTNQNKMENDKLTVWQLKELRRKLLEEFVLERRLAAEPGAGHQLEQLRRQVLCVTDVVQPRERVPQPLRPVKVQPLRLVQRQPRHPGPRRLRRRPQNLQFNQSIIQLFDYSIIRPLSNFLNHFQSRAWSFSHSHQHPTWWLLPVLKVNVNSLKVSNSEVKHQKFHLKRRANFESIEY